MSSVRDMMTAIDVTSNTRMRTMDDINLSTNGTMSDIVLNINETVPIPELIPASVFDVDGRKRSAVLDAVPDVVISRQPDLSASRITLPLIGYDAEIHQTFGNGSCLVQSLCHAIYPLYHTRMVDGVKVTRSEVIARFRRDLSESLVTINPSTGNIYYLSVHDRSGLSPSREHTIDESVALRMRRSIEDLEILRQRLTSRESIDHVVISLVEAVYGVSVYIIDLQRVMITTKDTYERCIVLQHSYGHFNPVSVIDRRTGIRSTAISHDHPLIISLNDLISYEIVDTD